MISIRDGSVLQETRKVDQLPKRGGCHGQLLDSQRSKLLEGVL